VLLAPIVNVASLIPALRQISPTAVPSSPCRRMRAICASVNFDLFMVLPRPTARITHAAKLEFSSKDRSDNREAGHNIQGLSHFRTERHPSRAVGDQHQALARSVAGVARQHEARFCR